MKIFSDKKRVVRGAILILVLCLVGLHIFMSTGAAQQSLRIARLIRVPTGLGADKYPGLEAGPVVLEAVLRKRIEIFQLDAAPGATSVPLRYSLEMSSPAWDVPVAEVELHDTRPEFQTVHHLEAIVDTCRALKEKVSQSIKDQTFPVVLGGDHSIAIGTVAGLMASLPKEKRVGMVWIDSHADYNTGRRGDVIGDHEYEQMPSVGPSKKLRASTTDTGHIHGMPVAVCVGKGDKALTDIFSEGRFIDPRDIVMLGLRDVEREQREELFRDGIRTVSARRMEYEGVGNIARETVRYLKERGVDAVHISFDIDSLDGILVPGTGTPASGGMSFREADLLLKLLRDWLPAQGIQILSFELTEVNPVRGGGVNDLTVKEGAMLISTFMGEETVIGDRFTY